MSGGEQQMLTLCRTLMGDPDLIMIDEPTEGVAPKIVQEIAELLREIARRGHFGISDRTKTRYCAESMQSPVCHGAWRDRF